ncbi:MAG: hypothetical protein ACM3Q2_12960 [Syntrophothermus sp.]
MKILFLGSGFTGRYFRYLYPHSIHSSRKKEFILKKGGGIVFDSNDPSTWKNASKTGAEGIIIAFPLTDITEPEKLFEFLNGISRRILLIGTTSGFKKGLREVDDYSPLDIENPRSAAEEKFRQLGAAVLHSAGIYGESRNPIDWIRKGYIRSRSSVVNLVHAEDLARACSFILEDFPGNERLVISDNHPYKWDEIINFAVRKGYISEPDIPSSGNGETRIVKPQRLFNMGFQLRHPSLYDELHSLEMPDEL